MLICFHVDLDIKEKNILTLVVWFSLVRHAPEETHDCLISNIFRKPWSLSLPLKTSENQRYRKRPVQATFWLAVVRYANIRQILLKLVR